MAAETRWAELASEISPENPPNAEPCMPHWSPLRTLASLDRRCEKRYAMVFPIRLHGFDEGNHYFSQKTFTLDVSAGGCRFTLDTEVKRGSVIAVSTIPRSPLEPQPQKALYEVMWVARHASGWEVGARCLDLKNIWRVSFPASVVHA